MGWDSATFRNKGTMGQAKNLATGPNGPEQPVKIRDRSRDGTITIFAPALVPGQRISGKKYMFVLGQRDKARPGLSQDVPRDFPSLANPSAKPLY